MTSKRARPLVGVFEFFRVFFVVGLTAFGAAVLQSLRSVPVKRGWLRREDIDEGLGLVQLYPGAMMVDLVAYVGYRTRRIRGALAATVGFVTPSVLLVLGLSWAYVEHGTGGGARDLVVGRTGMGRRREREQAHRHGARDLWPAPRTYHPAVYAASAEGSGGAVARTAGRWPLRAGRVTFRY